MAIAHRSLLNNDLVAENASKTYVGYGGGSSPINLTTGTSVVMSKATTHGR